MPSKSVFCLYQSAKWPTYCCEYGYKNKPNAEKNKTGSYCQTVKFELKCQKLNH